ncbi:MAG: HPF/RaiA family ribosome-associated protein [Proteobacteria bacterium]|nr:HPF/RaiA family ribosome-associated protein [Pseudomonadota bacterium]
MQIQINTGPNIEIHEAFSAEVSGIVESALNRFSDTITRVEVHLSDENSDKKVGHEAMRCMLEARIKGRQPIAVTNHASTLDEAVNGAADKLIRLIEHTIGRQDAQQNLMTDPDPSPPEPELEKEV